MDQVLLFFLIWLVAWLPIAGILSSSLDWTPFQPVTPEQKLPLVLSLYAIAPLILAGIIRWSDGSWRACGLSLETLQPGSFFAGLAASLGSMVVLFGFYGLVGWAELSRSTPEMQINASGEEQRVPENSENRAIDQTLSRMLIVFSLLLLGIAVGFIEELVFRGFLTRQFLDAFPLWIAGGIVSLIFAFLHLIWEGQDNIPQLPGLWVMGVVLTVAWWVDQQSIALAWGLHAGWVWSSATIDTLELVRYPEATPQWLTGRDGKLLAGVMGVGALALTGIWIGILF